MSSAAEAAVPLEDVMLAMDVVDTVRHRQLLVDRELDAESRRERLIARLREIYAAQGIDVSDAALEEGVRALEEDRFRYDPPAPGFANRLAHIYVNRGRWGKPLLAIVTLLLAVALAYYSLVYAPNAREQDALPAALDQTFERIYQLSKSVDATEQARELLADARRAIANERFDTARDVHSQMLGLETRLGLSYELRIVSRANQLSGVWRVPSVNTEARNYYLIVEAVDRNGQILSVPIENEEDGRTRTSSVWGVRVDEKTFEAVAADKRDDGIIQDDIIGRKHSGQLDPEYVVPTSGATITEW